MPTTLAPLTIANPGFESGDMTAWSVSDASVSVYNLGVNFAGDDAPRSGMWAARAGTTTPTSLWQDFDVSAFAELIDAGTVTLEGFGAWHASFDDQLDAGHLFADFLDGLDPYRRAAARAVRAGRRRQRRPGPRLRRAADRQRRPGPQADWIEMTDKKLFQLPVLDGVGANDLVYVSKADGSADGAASFATLTPVLGGVLSGQFAAASHAHVLTDITDAGALSAYAAIAPSPDVRGLLAAGDNAEIREALSLAASATTDTTNASNIVSGTLAANRGGAGTLNGLLKADGSGSVSAATPGLDFAPATSGSSIISGNGSGGFSNVTIGSGLNLSSGTLSASGAGAGLAEGAIFPASPVVGDLFWRSDRNILYFYNGSRWLTADLHTIQLPKDTLNFMSGTTADFTRLVLPMGGIYDFWMEDYVAATVVNGGASNGSNKWTVNLHNDGATTIASFDTGADAVNTWVRHRVSVNALAATSVVVLEETATKSGAPGGLFITSCITGRFVGWAVELQLIWNPENTK
jgi:hypothetical protein